MEQMQINPNDLVTMIGELHIEVATLRKANAKILTELENSKEQSKKKGKGDEK